MIAGFYIASHPWLNDHGVHKVGFTRDLRRRLHDSGYILCYSPEWYFSATFETISGEDAERLEGYVKEYFRDRRPWNNELVQAVAEEIILLADRVCEALGIKAFLKKNPKYVRPPLRRLSVSASLDQKNQAKRRDDLVFAGLLEAARDPMSVTVSRNDTAKFIAETREYQQTAVLNSLRDLGAASRAVLQMACRCGKTKVAYDVAQAYLRQGKRVLFLVPGLALLRQTAQKIVQYGYEGPLLLVGSDPLPVTFGPARTPAKMTTNPGYIVRALQQQRTVLVVSTYQSSATVPDGCDLIIFDEAHRVCGDQNERTFNYVLLNYTSRHQLFLTATPRYDGEISMNDRTRFGGVAFRYHLREGINAGYVNNFRLELVAFPGKPNSSFECKALLASQIIAAMEMSNVSKMLVFCRNINHIEALAEVVRTRNPNFVCYTAHSRQSGQIRLDTLKQFSEPGQSAVLFNCRLFQEGVEIPYLNAIFFASPRHSSIDIIQSICRPLNREPGKPPSVVFIPVSLDASSDVPESPANLRRFHTIVPFIDALLDEDPTFFDHLLGVGGPYPFGCQLQKGSPLSGTTHRILDAVKRVVRYGVTGKCSSSDRLLKASRIPWRRGFSALEYTVQQCGRYPKTVDAAEIAPGVFIAFHRWYKWAIAAYMVGKRLQIQPILSAIGPLNANLVADFCGYTAGTASVVGLEPFQVQQLESLPGWTVFGVAGPYPWDECMAFFEQWLETHSGEPPMVEINRGGYVGLDATWMERLSGAFTCVNQGDGRDRKRGGAGSGFTLSENKQDDLDRICTRFGLVWRKERHSNHSLLENSKRRYVGRKTFIQRAHASFKRRFRACGKTDPYFEQYFPGYHPQSIKYLYQERPDVYKKKRMPPKWRNVRIHKTK